MRLGREIKERLARGGTAVGSWLSLGDVGAAEIMALAGYDFLVIDLEHSPISIESTAAMIRAIDLAGSCPLVRLPQYDPALIKQVLDSGAHGIIVPNVASAELARNAVRATKYPPQGTRGVGLHRAQKYGAAFEEYMEAAPTGLLVVVQIESVEGVRNIKGIASVEGVDAVLIGPYDLSADMGSPGSFDSPPFKEAVELVMEGASDAGKATGLHIVEPDVSALRECHREGHRFLVYSVDMRILDVGARLGAQALGGV